MLFQSSSLSAEDMQKIAMEMNLSETAFLRPLNTGETFQQGKWSLIFSFMILFSTLAQQKLMHMLGKRKLLTTPVVGQWPLLIGHTVTTLQ